MQRWEIKKTLHGFENPLLKCKVLWMTSLECCFYDLLWSFLQFRTSLDTFWDYILQFRNPFNTMYSSHLLLLLTKSLSFESWRSSCCYKSPKRECWTETGLFRSLFQRMTRTKTSSASECIPDWNFNIASDFISWLASVKCRSKFIWERDLDIGVFYSSSLDFFISYNCRNCN